MVGFVNFGGVGVVSPPPRTGYDPVAALGADLLGYWDAARAGTMTIGAGGAVSSWRDVIGSYDLSQVSGPSMPIYSATSFNGGPALTFDGIDDELGIVQTPTSFPSVQSGNPSIPTETWMLIDQQATTGQHSITSMGAGQTSVRSIQTLSTSVPNAATGDGSGTTFVPAVAINARCVVRCEFGATATGISVDGVAYALKNVVPYTGARMRIGADTSTTAARFWTGQVAALLITAPLSSDKAAKLQAWLMNRRNV